MVGQDKTINIKHEKAKNTECICPKCKTEHEVYLYWIGNGKPRIYCPFCKLQINKFSTNINFNYGSRSLPKNTT